MSCLYMYCVLLQLSFLQLCPYNLADPVNEGVVGSDPVNPSAVRMAKSYNSIINFTSSGFDCYHVIQTLIFIMAPTAALEISVSD